MELFIHYDDIYCELPILYRGTQKIMINATNNGNEHPPHIVVTKEINGEQKSIAENIINSDYKGAMKKALKKWKYYQNQGFEINPDKK